MNALYKLILITLTSITVWVVTSFRLGGVVPEDFVNSEIPVQQLTFDTFQTYSPTELRRLALKMFEQGHPDKAEFALQQSLARDPANALSVAALAQLYLQQKKIEQAQFLLKHSQRLWPAKFYQLQKRHVNKQAKKQLNAQLTNLRLQIKDKKELQTKIKQMKNKHNKQLEIYMKKLEQETLNAYQ